MLLWPLRLTALDMSCLDLFEPTNAHAHTLLHILQMILHVFVSVLCFLKQNAQMSRTYVSFTFCGLFSVVVAFVASFCFCLAHMLLVRFHNLERAAREIL